MPPELQILENLPQHVVVFAIILGALTLAFVLFFLLPSFVVSWRLSRVVRRLRKLAGPPSAKLDEVFARSGVLEHLWREYSHTLHEQTAADAATGQTASRWRSTVPAEALFRPEIIVDTPLKTEFFRHLPGIFTGVGIIGTFYGLLIGLRAFQVSENPVIVRDSLNNLLHGVYEAFFVSAAAIALAMVITLIEKLVVARLSGKVERLVQLLDGMFEAGAGEEYLARLVKASESSATHAAVLKESAVDELRKILDEIGNRQIAASNAASTTLGDRMAHTLEAGIRGPMTDIADAVKGLRADQWASVQSMLNEVLTANSRQLKEMFGEQIAGINATQQQTVAALQNAVGKLDQMASSVESAGQRGASAMAERLTQAVEAAEQRQRVMNDTMAEFVQQIRQVVGQSQGETQARLESTLDLLSQRMASVTEALARQVESAADTSAKHHDALSGRLQSTLEALSTRMGGVIDALKGQVEAAADVSAKHHDALASRLGSTLDDFSNRVGGVTDALAKQVEAAANTSAQHHDALAARLNSSLDDLTNRMGAVTDGLAKQVEAAANSSAQHHDALAGRLHGSLEELSNRMGGVTESLVRQVEAAADTSAKHHDALSSRLQSSLDELGTRMGSIVDGLAQQIQSSAEASRQQHDALTGQTTRIVGEMGGQVGAIVDGVNRAVGEMKVAVDALQRIHSDAITQLDSGAKAVSSAAADFARSGTAVSGALEKSEVVSARLSEVAGTLAAVSSNLTGVVSDYQGARDAVAELVRSLQSAVEHARKDTLLADDVLGRIESATSRLAEAQRESDGYLERVSRVIEEAHGSFSEGVTRTVGEVNQEFHRQLSESVRLLRSGIEELQATLETIGTR
jgi:DNA anti-recombination protein RmuC